jgi:hypothetical protein
MPPGDLLAISLLSGRDGIAFMALVALFSIGLTLLISFLDRHEYCPSGYGVFGVIAISFLSAIIGSAIGSLEGEIVRSAFTFVFCGTAAFLTSGPFLEFRLPHRLTLAISAPLIFISSAKLGVIIQEFVIENALK